jgi:prevent-host-death family protein
MKAKPSSEPPGEVRASVRELKARFSHYLRLTKAGKTVEITERGTPIGRIVPTSGALAERIEALARFGPGGVERAQAATPGAGGQGEDA